MRRRTSAVFAGFAIALAIMLLTWWLRPSYVSVYFIRSAGDASTLEAVSRQTRARSVEGRSTAALEALLAGPTAIERAAGLVTAIPPEARLRGVDVRGGVVYVDLTAEIESGGGSSSMLGRFWQIVFTATQFRQASQARILIDGEPRHALGGEGVLIDQPIGRPRDLPRF